MNIPSQLKVKLSIIFLIIIYKITLEQIYIFYIHPRYEYMGFILDINYYKYIFSWIFIISIILVIPKIKKLPSTLSLYFIFLISIIPISGIYWLQNAANIYFICISIAFLITILIVQFSPIIIFKYKVKKFNILLQFSVLFSIIVYLILFYFNGIPTLSALNFNKVYIVRNNFNYGINLMAYLVTWQAWVLNPYLMILSISRRKYRWIIIPIVLQIVLFLYTGLKAYLFIPVLLLLLAKLIKSEKFNQLVLYGMVFGNILCVAAFEIFNNDWPLGLYAHRLLYLPAQISYQYYEYFSTNGLVLLSHSVFETLFINPIYDKHPILLIGEVYYDDNWPNTGYLGDAYMNFGIIGLLVYSILLAIILKILDSFAKKLGVFPVILLSITLMFYLVNGALLTALLNGGILFLFGLLLITPYFEKHEIKNNI